MVIHDKIFWNGFIRQLKELYFLLYLEKYISCGIDEFLPHFTGKKWRDETKSYKGKIKWLKEEYLFILLINHLIEKRFFNYTQWNLMPVLKKHFIPFSGTSFKLNKHYKSKPGAKELQRKLECLLPENTGLRCRERKYYKARNEEPVFAVLEKCGINFKKSKSE